MLPENQHEEYAINNNRRTEGFEPERSCYKPKAKALPE
jgi:hypothetical protein